MRNLLAFLLRYQGVLLFGLLEVVCLYLFLTNSSYQRAAVLNSANAYAGAVLARREQITDYFHLADQNRALLAENAQLRQQLFQPDFSHREADSLPVGRDTLGRLVYRHLRPLPASLVPRPRPAVPRPDSLLLGGVRVADHDPDYPLVPARVVNNSLREVDNYLTLNVGAADGVQPGQGVLSVEGVVGRVKSVSAHYATVLSLLHSKTAVAAKLKRDGTFGSVKWPGDDYRTALLDYIPRQNRVLRGDSVVTSGYNAVFPENVFIGTVSSFVKEPDKNFWTVQVKLGPDFSRLTYVYVVRSRPQPERDSLIAASLNPAVAPITGATSATPAAGTKPGATIGIKTTPAAGTRPSVMAAGVKPGATGAGTRPGVATARPAPAATGAKPGANGPAPGAAVRPAAGGAARPAATAPPRPTTAPVAVPTPAPTSEPTAPATSNPTNPQ